MHLLTKYFFKDSKECFIVCKSIISFFSESDLISNAKFNLTCVTSSLTNDLNHKFHARHLIIIYGLHSLFMWLFMKQIFFLDISSLLHTRVFYIYLYFIKIMTEIAKDFFLKLKIFFSNNTLSKRI